MKFPLKYIIPLIALIVIIAIAVFFTRSNNTEVIPLSQIDNDIALTTKKQVVLDSLGVTVSVPDYWIEYQPYTSANRFFFNSNVNEHIDTKRGTNHSIATIPNPTSIQATQIVEDLKRRNWTGEVNLSSVNNLPLISFTYQTPTGLERTGLLLKDRMLYAITGDLLSPSILNSMQFEPPAIAKETAPLKLGKYSEGSLEELGMGWVYDDGAPVTVQFNFTNQYHPEQPFTTSFSTTDPQNTFQKQPRADVFEYLRSKGIYAVFGNQGFQGSFPMPIGKYRLNTATYNGMSLNIKPELKANIISTGDSVMTEASNIYNRNLSPDGRYYHTTSPGPEIFTDLKTGIRKPLQVINGREFIEARNIIWSPDSKYIAFSYRIPDSEYLFPILNILSIDEIMSGNYKNDKRVLSASEHQSYAWQNANALVVITQNTKNQNYLVYENTYVAIYHLDRTRDEFEYITTQPLKNKGEATISPNTNKILFTPDTATSQYTITTLEGAVIKTIPQYTADWYR